MADQNRREAYYIRATGSRGNFEVQDSEQRVWAYLNYEGLLSSRVSGQANRHELEIAPKNIFQSKFDVILDGEDVGDIIFNWKGQMVIRLLDFHRQEREYLLRRRGAFRQRFVLEDDIKNPIFVMQPRFNWRKMSYDFRVYLRETQYLQSPLEAMLAISAYAAKLYMKRQAAAAAS